MENQLACATKEESRGRYIEVAFQLASRGLVIPLPSLPVAIEHAQATQKELYRSYFEFDEEVLEHRKLYKTLKGFKGKYYISWIVLDVDRKGINDEDCLSRTRVVASRVFDLFRLDENDLRCYFSGTGYHLTFPDVFGFTPSHDLPGTVRATIQKLFPETDMIADTGRIIRVAGTINKKSNLYKIHIPTPELFRLSVAQIKEAASVVPVAKDDSEDWTAEAITERKFPELIATPPRPQLSAMQQTGEPIQPTQIVTCVQKMYSEGGGPGNRHVRMLRIASAWRRAGLPMEAVFQTLVGAGWDLPNDEIQKLVSNVYTKPLRYSCDDELMAKYCDSHCIHYKLKNYGDKVLSSKDMEDGFRNFVRNDMSAQTIDLATIMPIEEFTLQPEEMILLLGDTGIGKTAWAQWLCTRMKKFKILYLNLEFSSKLLFRRFVQQERGWTKQQVLDHYRSSDSSKIEGLDHIHCLFIPPTLANINKTVALERPQLVVVDTTDCIRTDDWRAYEEEGVIAFGLSQLAQTRGVIVLAVHHISKAASERRDWKTGEMVKPELTKHSGKGNSAFEQKADKVIGLEYVEGQPLMRTIKSLKARDEAPFQVKMLMNPNTFTFENRQESINELRRTSNAVVTASGITNAAAL